VSESFTMIIYKWLKKYQTHKKRGVLALLRTKKTKIFAHDTRRQRNLNCVESGGEGIEEVKGPRLKTSWEYYCV